MITMKMKIRLIIIIIPFDAGGEVGEGDGVNAGNVNKNSMSSSFPHSAANFLTTS